jgi:hypothetical protein
VATDYQTKPLGIIVDLVDAASAAPMVEGIRRARRRAYDSRYELAANRWTLSHYGTELLWLHPNSAEIVGGWSASDARAMCSFLTVFGCPLRAIRRSGRLSLIADERIRWLRH